MMAAANLSRQRQDPLHALSAFAQASTVAGQQDHGIAESSQYTAADQEGRQINEKLSIVPEASFAPSLEDINVYTLDARILNVTNPALLPPPRHSYQSLAESHYRVSLGNFPAITGFVGESLTAGTLLYPSIGVVQDRNTYDTVMNGGITPILHFGTNCDHVQWRAAVHHSARHDLAGVHEPELCSASSCISPPVRSSIGFRSRAAPFTRPGRLPIRICIRAMPPPTLNSLWAALGKYFPDHGYSARDLLFRPLIEEYFNTSSYAGLQHKFGSRLTAAVLAEYLRSWRVQGTQYAIAQALLPGGSFEFRANPRWSVQGSFLLSRGSGYHAYDNAQSEFLVSYIRPLHGKLKDGIGESTGVLSDALLVRCAAADVLRLPGIQQKHDPAGRPLHIVLGSRLASG